MRHVVAAAAILLAGCLLLPSPGPGAHDIHVRNGTALDVGIRVNGTIVRVFTPTDSGEIAASTLPPLPWTVDAVTAGGRVLLSFDVEAGSVDVEGPAQQGRGGRADLSCGRLDVYVGPPMMGPAPGRGTPGDCVP